MLVGNLAGHATKGNTKSDPEVPRVCRGALDFFLNCVVSHDVRMITAERETFFVPHYYPVCLKLSMLLALPTLGNTLTRARFKLGAAVFEQQRQLFAEGHGGGDSTGPRTPTTPAPPPPPPRAFGQQLVAKGVALRRPWAPKAPDAP